MMVACGWNRVRRDKIHRWEWGIGDKAYVGCPEIMTEFKGSRLRADQLQYYNNLIQHYRGRVEHLINEVTTTRKTLHTTWRGSFSLLAAIMKICAHMVGHWACRSACGGQNTMCLGLGLWRPHT
jgi:hypothetical protein